MNNYTINISYAALQDKFNHVLLVSDILSAQVILQKTLLFI